MKLIWAVIRWFLRQTGNIWWQKPKTDPYKWSKQPWVIIDCVPDQCGCRRDRFVRHVLKHRLRHGMYYPAVHENFQVIRFVFKLYGPRPQLPKHMNEFTALVDAACLHTPAASVIWKPKDMKKSHVNITHKED